MLSADIDASFCVMHNLNLSCCKVSFLVEEVDVMLFVGALSRNEEEPEFSF
jgi:hypothetical protein